MSKEEVKFAGLIVLENCVVAICFTILAALFDKWWIALFSALYFKGISYKKGDGK